jgi:transcriptional regulator with XRE-family HTH domain
MGYLTLQQSQYYELKQLDIGPRIRYIRELLHKHHGSEFSARGVAERVKVISYAALASIERGDTKDPSARVVHAIAKYFKVDMYVFFDDYYEGEYRPIDIGYTYIQLDESEELDENDKLAPTQDSNGHRIVIEIYEVSDKMDRRNLVTIWSKQKIDKKHTIQLITTAHQQLDTLDKILGEDFGLESERSSYFWGKEHYEKRTQAAFPWIPEDSWTRKRNEMYDIGREYTRQLLQSEA